MNFIVALDETIKTFEEAKKVATSKSYDYLDPRNSDFDSDYDVFMSKTDALKRNVGGIIETNYADVWETPQGIRFLTRFEKVNIRNTIVKILIGIAFIVYCSVYLGKRKNTSDKIR